MSSVDTERQLSEILSLAKKDRALFFEELAEFDQFSYKVYSAIFNDLE